MQRDRISTSGGPRFSSGSGEGSGWLQMGATTAIFYIRTPALSMYRKVPPSSRDDKNNNLWIHVTMKLFPSSSSSSSLTYLYHHHHHQHLVPYTHKVHIVVEWRTDEAEVPHRHPKPGSNHITFTIQDHAHAHAHASRSRLTFTTTGARGSDASGCISLNPFSRCARVCVRPVPDSSTYYGTTFLLPL